MVQIVGNANLADIVAVACDREHVSISATARAAVEERHQRAKSLARTKATYGRTTGVGANRATAVADGDTQHGMRLLRSHAVDAGNPLPDMMVRAMLAVRLNQLCVVGSGIDPRVLDGLVEMLNRDSLPAILEYSSIGTGDLSALAGTALTMMGERPASGALSVMPRWGSDSALPFISSSALTLGRCCLIVDDLQRLSAASEVIYALSFVALGGNRSTFSMAAARASASPEVSDIAKTLRRLLGDDTESARIQDPYGLRAFPIALAPLLGSLRRLETQLLATANAAQENPLFSETDVVHHAGFFQAALALDLDAVALAAAQLTPLAISRLRMMSEPTYSGQEPFLASGPAGSSGTMIIEYVAAAAHGRIHALAHPSSPITVVLSRGAEEDATFAPTAVERLEGMIPAMRVLLGCELLDAIRLLRQKGTNLHTLPSTELKKAFSLCDSLTHDDTDRDLRPDLALAQQLIDNIGERS